MVTRAQRLRQRKNRAEVKRATDGATRTVRHLVRLATAETAKYSTLHRLHAAGRITYEQWQAGLRFQQDELASRDVRTMDLDPDKIRGAGGVPTDRLSRQVDSLAATRDAMAVLSRKGKLAAHITTAVCIGDAMPAAIARAIKGSEAEVTQALREGLEALRGHYGSRRR